MVRAYLQRKGSDVLSSSNSSEMVMKKGTLILDTYNDCYDIGIVDHKGDHGVNAHWFEYRRLMFVEDNFALLSGSCLGKWE
jgi:hypothetical protein